MRGWHILHDDLAMEIALLIENEEDYKGNRIDDYYLTWGSETNGLKDIYQQIKKFYHKKIDLLYLGNEFCEYRIPTVKQLEGVLDICKKDKISCVLVTPVVTDYGIEKTSNLLDYLIHSGISIDIVVNDMGVLELLRRRAYEGKAIIGRILEKSSHDCRASRQEFNDYYGDNGKKFAKTPGVFSDFTQTIFRKYGVERYEFDLPRIGLEMPKEGNYSLYWPYSYLTTGRVCMFRSLDLSGRDKFLVGGSGCNKKCMEYKVEKRKPINGYSLIKRTDLFLFQKGNTLFFINEESDLCIDCFNRLIIQL